MRTTLSLRTSSHCILCIPHICSEFDARPSLHRRWHAHMRVPIVNSGPKYMSCSIRYEFKRIASITLRYRSSLRQISKIFRHPLTPISDNGERTRRKTHQQITNATSIMSVRLHLNGISGGQCIVPCILNTDCDPNTTFAVGQDTGAARCG